MISSIVQHHDKFGVVSTGEGGLPIFSDIPYFSSDKSSIEGIKKNVTSVMLVNLADIAGVNVADNANKNKSLQIAGKIKEIREGRLTEDEIPYLDELLQLCKEPASCLGIGLRKVRAITDDWKILLAAIEDNSVQGSRVQLKRRLFELEKNPARTILRILRLLQEVAATAGGNILIDKKYLSPTIVESVLVGTLGAYQFQTFCEQFATIVKMDYALNFFKAVFCACVRKKIYSKNRTEIEKPYSMAINTEKELDWGRLDAADRELLDNLSNEERFELVRKITSIVIKVLESLVDRYVGVLDCSSLTPRRFGFQLRELTLDAKIREAIIDILCIHEGKDSVALSWIVDEVTIWSFD